MASKPLTMFGSFQAPSATTKAQNRGPIVPAHKHVNAFARHITDAFAVLAQCLSFGLRGLAFVNHRIAAGEALPRPMSMSSRHHFCCPTAATFTGRPPTDPATSRPTSSNLPRALLAGSRHPPAPRTRSWCRRLPMFSSTVTPRSWKYPSLLSALPSARAWSCVAVPE